LVELERRRSSQLLSRGLNLIVTFTIVNRHQVIAIFVLLALMRAEAITRQADIIAALTLEVLKGTTRAFDAGQSLRNLS